MALCGPVCYRRLLCLFQSIVNLVLLYVLKYRKNCIYYVIRSNCSAVITHIETVLQLCGPREYIRDADGVMRTGLLMRRLPCLFHSLF